MADIPALGILLDNLKESVLYNTGLIGGPINNDLKGLCEDLDALKALIKNYQGWQNDKEFIQKLGNDIRDAVFQAEYAIETYIVRASKQKHRSVIEKYVHITEYLSELRSLGKQIAQTREQLAKLSQSDLPRIGLEALQVYEISSRGPTKKQALLFMEDNVVGLEDSAEEVIRLLTGESLQQSDELEVISIIGMPGLGKTTLAKKVLNDPKIEYEFYARAFVHVSQEYEKKDVFLRILATITQIDEEMNTMSEDELARVLREQLGTKKFLIVMDDVWTTDTWDKLKSAFPNNKKHSRVLLTSRHASVAHYANRKIGPYYLRFLFPEESRELLQRKVFGGNFCPHELEMYESNILNKCDGLPLAILLVAGILLNNRESTDWWMRVAENVNDYVAKNDEQSNDVIRSSYNHLPYYLKPCFLYLGVFPESFEIPVWRLLRLWIAEGFIRHEGFMNMEDTAEEYLAELVDRSLVMIGQKRSNGQIKTCRITDMLRYFCKTEAMKENLFREIKRFDEAASSSDKYRRLVLNSHVLEYIKAKPTGDHVRSFLCFSKEENLLLPEHVSSIPKAFKLLRVLDVRSIVFTRFPVEFIYLVLLKYIAISCNFKVLPEKMSILQNLQTIVIETSSNTLDIKADIWKMAQLRHFHSNSSTFLRKGKEESLINANLQTLSTISAESCRREVFERTPKLRKLGVRGRLGTIIEGGGDSSLFDSLARLNFLENLKLLNDDIASKLHSLPRENKFPRKLTRLTLLNTSLDWRHMSTLGKLENLEVLKLKDNAFVGQLWVTEDGGFRRLTVLHIGRTDIVVWKASASNFPTLRSLFLRHCDKLDGIPPDLGDIPSLHLIDLYYTNSMVASSARKILLLNLRLKAQEKILKGSKLKLSVYPPDF